MKLLVVSVLIVALSYAEGDVVLPDTMFYIGSVGDKAFYGDRTFKRWEEAEVYCREYGMKLISVTSQAQHALLKRFFVEDYLRMWTAGRDALGMRVISWYNTGHPGQQPTVPYGGTLLGTPKICLVGENVQNEFYFYLDDCTRPNQILCEMSNEIRAETPDDKI